MTSDDKFNSLAELVRESKIREKELFAAHQAAQSAWKEANTQLTERMKVFDSYVDQIKLETLQLEG